MISLRLTLLNIYIYIYIYIGTQTDDVETTEVWRDHQDISILKPERHEQISELFKKSEEISCELREYALEREDMEIGLIALITLITLIALIALIALILS